MYTIDNLENYCKQAIENETINVRVNFFGNEGHFPMKNFVNEVSDFNETYKRLEQFYLNFIKNFKSFDVAFKAMSRKYVIENYIMIDESTTYILFDYDYTLLIKDYSNTYCTNIKLDINDIKNDISIVEYMINQVNNQINLFQSFKKNNQ